MVLGGWSVLVSMGVLGFVRTVKVTWILSFEPWELMFGYDTTI